MPIGPAPRTTTFRPAYTPVAFGVGAKALRFVNAPLLRIPEPSGALAAMALDGGAHGVIVPYVETVEQVREVVGAVKFRPLKGRALAQAVEQGELDMR